MTGLVPCQGLGGNPCVCGIHSPSMIQPDRPACSACLRVQRSAASGTRQMRVPSPKDEEGGNTTVPCQGYDGGGCCRQPPSTIEATKTTPCYACKKNRHEERRAAKEALFAK